MEPLRVDGELWAGPVIYENGAQTDFDAARLRYDDIVKDGLEAVVRRHIRDHYQGLFFVKSLDWASEFEFRFVSCSPTPRPAFVDVSSALAAVVVGEDFPTQDANLLRALTEQFEHEILVGRCTWRNGAPVVIPGPQAVPVSSFLTSAD